MRANLPNSPSSYPVITSARMSRRWLPGPMPALTGISWEAVFVDDNSPDGTADTVREIARRDRRVRCVRRIGRRGLASAVIEGALSSSADYVCGNGWRSTARRDEIARHAGSTSWRPLRYTEPFGWTPAGAAGAAVGVVWNYAVSATLVWSRR
jgi:hypothetical protein